MTPLKNYFQSGFTLAEMVITITIFVLIVGAVFSAYTLSHRAYLEGEKAAEITQNGRVILERMTREIRQAKEIVTELSTTSTDATSTIEFQDGHDISTIHYIRYFKDDTNIKREKIVYNFDETATSVSWNAKDEYGNPPTPSIEESAIIGEYVNNLEVWGMPVINISLTLEKSGKTINLKTAIFGRNL